MWLAWDVSDNTSFGARARFPLSAVMVWRDGNGLEAIQGGASGPSIARGIRIPQVSDGTVAAGDGGGVYAECRSARNYCYFVLAARQNLLGELSSVRWTRVGVCLCVSRTRRNAG